MNTIKVYWPCPECEGVGEHVWARDGTGSQLPATCHVCKGSGKGRLKEIREEVEDRPPRSNYVPELKKGDGVDVRSL